MKQSDLKELITQFDLKPHPEGGYFKETYRSNESILKTSLPDRYSGNRPFGTAIYFLLEHSNNSKLHRLKSDELWHFYLGDPFTLVTISPSGEVNQIVMGQDVLNGQLVQFFVPAGYWLGGYLNKDSKFSFVGCTVSPGFDFDDFELGNREDLLNQFPHAKDIIELLT